MQHSVHFYNINHLSAHTPLEEAVLQIENTGSICYIPEQIPLFNDTLIYKNPPPSFREVAFEILRFFFQSAVPDDDLYALIANTFPFRVPVFPIDPRTYLLEMTHSSTGYCTDFGARFTAQLVSYFRQKHQKQQHLLYAGNDRNLISLAQAFSEKPAEYCTFLYPKGCFPQDIEQQLLSLPKNISLFPVDGSLNDCRKIIETLSKDTVIRQKFNIFTPHTTHIAYLFAYTFCSMYAALIVLSRSGYDNSIEKPRIIMGVPLYQPAALSAAIMSKRMNAPFTGFIAAADKAILQPSSWLQSFGFHSENKNPTSERNDFSEYSRIRLLHGSKPLHHDIALYYFPMKDILEAIRMCNDRTGCIISPEAAAVWRAWNIIRNEHHDIGVDTLPYWISDKKTMTSCISIITETSHPALHISTVKDAIGREPSIPYRFEYRSQIKRTLHPIPCSSDILKEHLLALS